MSKELEALEILYSNAKLDRDRIEAGGIVTYAEEIEHNERIKPYYDTIKQALLKTQQQDFNNSQIVMPFFDELVKLLGTNDIDEMLDKIKEQEKVLNIIIKKNVSVWGFRNRVFGYQKEQNGNRIINDTYEYYINNFGCYHNGFDIELLTEEEFNLLKEYFK